VRKRRLKPDKRSERSTVNIEKTFIMIKPDSVQRGLAGQILARFEARAMKIVALKLIMVTDKLAKEQYAEHLGKDFYPRLMRHIRSGPVLVGVIEAPDAVAQVRKMVGATDPANAEVGSIRQAYCQDIALNAVHASDSLSTAEREIGIYFRQDEILSYELDIHRWLYPAE
jgi:nucleoside-diphosphate kinase